MIVRYHIRVFDHVTPSKQQDLRVAGYLDPRIINWQNYNLEESIENDAKIYQWNHCSLTDT